MNDRDLIERARGIDLLVVAERHGLKLAKRGREYLGPCPHCGGCSRFSINPSKGLFLCRGCSKGGAGAIDLEIFITGGDFNDATQRLTGEALPSAQEARAAAAKRRVQQKETQAEQIKTAQWLWSIREPAAGSIVETYVRGRGYRDTSSISASRAEIRKITIPAIIPPTIGFLPARDKYPPAIIAAFALPREQEGELVAPLADDVRAVHLTRLLPDGSDRRRDKDEHGRERGNKIVIGAPLGFPLVIAPVSDSLSLVITEGVEDALAYRAAGFAAWAAGSADYIPALVNAIPTCIETIIIERHPDEAARRSTNKLRVELAARKPPPEIIVREA